MPVGIIACAFGQQSTNTAGPSNEAIGRIARQIKQATGGLISTQWEVDAYLQSVGDHADHLVSAFGTDSHYVTTEQVFDSSLAFFKTTNVTEVIIIAQPMHLKVIRLVMNGWVHDSNVRFSRRYDHLMRQIPFDRSPGNQQGWTQGPIRFGAYLVRAKLFGTHGK